MNNINLFEDSRNSLKSQAIKGDTYAPDNRSKGKNRYARSVHSSFAKSVKSYNEMDMDALFKYDILTVNILIDGETDTYTVTVKMGSLLDNLRHILGEEQINLRYVTKALIKTFNDASTDIYLHCSCKDWKYRMDFWASKNDINAGEPQDIPSDETNPNDTKGPGCKHALACLSRTTWLMKVASVITNYVKYMEKNYPDLYTKVIYPAIYGKKYEETEVETEIDDTENTEEQEQEEDEDGLPTDVGTIDSSNRYAKIKNLKQFRDKPVANVETNTISDTI